MARVGRSRRARGKLVTRDLSITTGPNNRPDGGPSYSMFEMMATTCGVHTSVRIRTNKTKGFSSFKLQITDPREVKEVFISFALLLLLLLLSSRCAEWQVQELRRLRIWWLRAGREEERETKGEKGKMNWKNRKEDEIERTKWGNGIWNGKRAVREQ